MYLVWNKLNMIESRQEAIDLILISIFVEEQNCFMKRKRELLIFSVVFIGLQRCFDFCIIKLIIAKKWTKIPNSNFPPVLNAIHGLSTALYFLALLFPLSFCGQQPKAWLRDPTKWAKLHLFQPHYHRVNCHTEKLTKIKKFPKHILNICNCSQIFISASSWIEWWFSHFKSTLLQLLTFLKHQIQQPQLLLLLPLSSENRPPPSLLLPTILQDSVFSEGAGTSFWEQIVSVDQKLRFQPWHPWLVVF